MFHINYIYDLYEKSIDLLRSLDILSIKSLFSCYENLFLQISLSNLEDDKKKRMDKEYRKQILLFHDQFHGNEQCDLEALSTPQKHMKLQREQSQNNGLFQQPTDRWKELHIDCISQSNHRTSSCYQGG